MEENVFQKLLVKILSDRFDKDFDKKMRVHKIVFYMLLVSSVFLIRNPIVTLLISVVAVIVLILAGKTVATQLNEETETTLDNVLALLEENGEITETEILWKIANREI